MYGIKNTLRMSKGVGNAFLAVFLLPIMSQAIGTESSGERLLSAAGCTDPRTPLNLGKLPLMFVPNQGQSDSSHDFVAHSYGGGALFFGDGAQTLLSLHRIDARPAALIRASFVGAESTKAVTEEMLSSRTHYLVGRSSRDWITDLPNYSGLRYHGLYPGISLRYGGDGRRLKATLTVQPGAAPDQIRWKFGEAVSIKESRRRDLRISVPSVDDQDTQVRTVILRKPWAWQEIDGERREVVAGYEFTPFGQVSWHIGAFDRTQPLYITSWLNFSPFIIDYAAKEDGQGVVYAAGATHTMKPGEDGSRDAFLVRLESDRVISSTFLGGSKDDAAYGLAIGWDGSVYLTGETKSADFSRMNGVGLRYAKRRGSETFVTRLENGGRDVLRTHILGGPGADAGHDVLVDDSGAVFVTGKAGDRFPLVNPGGSDFSAILPKASAKAQESYFLARLDQSLGRLESSSRFRGGPVGSPLRIWKNCNGEGLSLGVPTQPAPLPRAQLCGPLLQRAATCTTDETFRINCYDSSNYDFGLPTNGPFCHAHRWKECDKNVFWNFNGVQDCGSTFSIGSLDHLTLNNDENNSAIFPNGNPPGSWESNDSFNHEELAVGAALYMDRWGSPVYASLRVSGSETAAAITKITFNISSPFFSMSDLCGSEGWNNNSTPIDQVDDACEFFWGNSFSVTQVYVTVWESSYRQNVPLNGSAFFNAYFTNTFYIGDPPEGDEDFAEAIPEIARRLRGQIYVEVDSEDIEQTIFRQGIGKRAVRPANSKVLMRAIDLTAGR